jgi:hypothetical protein
MEHQLGADLTNAKVHTGSESASAAEALSARAFTVGDHVHFGAGQYAPGTKEGDRLLAHELTHVVQAQRSGVQRKIEDGGGDGGLEHGRGGQNATTGDANASDAHEHGAHEVSRPGDPAEKEADSVADSVAEQLHGSGAQHATGAARGEPGAKTDASGGEPQDARADGNNKSAVGHDNAAVGGEKHAGRQKAPAIGAKSAGQRIFRAAGDPKSVAELVTKLTGKALEAYKQMKELEQQHIIDGMCASARIKQADGTLNLPAAQAMFEARWLDPTKFAGSKLLKDKAQRKKIDDALMAIKNSCDETDGTNRPGASLPPGTSEVALVWEAENGKPWKSKEGHYQKVPNYIGTIEAAVAVLTAEQSKITDATLLDEVRKAIDRGTKRVAKMKPSVDTWKNRVALYPTVWKSDGDSKVQPGFPAIK